MPTEKDTLVQFTELRTALLDEKATLEARLLKIQEALSLGDQPVPAGATPAAAPVKAKRKRGRKKLARARNAISLRKAILQVLGTKTLTKEEILDAVKGLGYKFATKDPMGSVNAVLYAAKNKFQNEDGKFSAPQ